MDLASLLIPRRTPVAASTSIAQHTAAEDSDIDLLVDLVRPIGFFELVALEREHTEAMGRSVDLQTEAALSPYLRDAILRDARVIYAA